MEGILHRLLILKRTQGITDGPAMSNCHGRLLTTYAVNDCLIEVLCDLFEERKDLFPVKISSLEEVRKRYHIYRSMRRTSDTRALEMKVDGDDIDIVNRWVSVEKAKGGRPDRTMKHHYADVTLLLKPFTRYTWAM